MAQAFADVSEIDLFGDRLAEAADAAPERVRDFVAEALDDAADKMREEIPEDEGEERASVTVEVDGDGLGGSVGPTKTDAAGRPTGFFLNYGQRSAAPEDFIGRTTQWAEGHFPALAEQLLDDIL